MAKIELVRKNILNNQWEHYVSDVNNSHWSPGLTGYENSDMLKIIENQIKIGEVNFDSSTSTSGHQYIISYEGISGKISKLVSPDYAINMTNNMSTYSNYINTIDIGFRELIKDKNPQIILEPIIDNNLNLILKGELKVSILLGFKMLLRMQAINPVYDDLTDLIFSWYKDDNQTAVAASITVGEDDNDSGNWKGCVESKDGKSETTEIEINVANPHKTKKFYTNLIKNGDASANLNGWEIIQGIPEVKKIGFWPNQQSDLYYDDAYFNRDWIDSFGESIDSFGPILPTVIDGNFDELVHHSYYMCGGLSGQETTSDMEGFTVIKQDIFLDDVADYIDRKVVGVNDVFGNLFGWLGCAGLCGGLDVSYEERTFGVWARYDLGYDVSVDIELEDLKQKFANWYWVGLDNADMWIENGWQNGLEMYDYVTGDSTSPIYSSDDASEQNDICYYFRWNNKVGINGPSNNLTWSAIVGKWNGNKWSDEYNNLIKILDRVYVQIKLFDLNNKEISCDYMIDSPIHTGVDFKFILRQEYLYIPIGTRRIEIWVKFQRSDYAIINPWSANTQFVKWAKWDSNNAAFKQIHSSAFSNLNLHLYINNTDEFENRINTYYNQTHFNRYDGADAIDSQMFFPGTTNLRYITNIAGFIRKEYLLSDSAIQLKVYDLAVNYGYLTFDELYNDIISDNWYTNKFSPARINNGIINAVQKYSLDIDISGKSIFNINESNNYSDLGYWTTKFLS